jgi:hypothetical protein
MSRAKSIAVWLGEKLKAGAKLDYSTFLSQPGGKQARAFVFDPTVG